MANICSVKFRKSVDLNPIGEILDKINHDDFGGQLHIEEFIFKGSLAGYTLKISERPENQTTFWIQEQKLEWKHHYDQLMWWMVSTVMSKLVRSLDPNAKLSDEGIEEKIKPDFDMKYPKPINWLMALSFAVQLDQKLIDQIQKKVEQSYSQLVPNFWEAVNR